MQLTREQLAVLRHTKKPALVTAGAGCGKTTILIEYIAKKLLKRGTPKYVLVLTFSKAARDELKTRLQQRLTKPVAEYPNLTVMTYDAFGYSLVQQNYKKLGYRSAPKAITDKSLLNQCINEVVARNIDQENIPKTANDERKMLTKDLTKAVREHNNWVASGRSTVTLQQKNPLIKAVLERYKEKKKAKNLVDFDDMVGKLLIEKNFKLLEVAAQGYDYLLVDELQDTSVKQTKMLLILARNIPASVMVGDPKQAINAFRGAYVKNWDTIKTTLQPMEYPLTQSQRVPAQSLKFINAVGNQIYPGAPLVSDVKGLAVLLVDCQTIAEQAQFIASKINHLLDKGVKPDQIACLGRTKRSLSNLTIALQSRNIITHELFREPINSHEKKLRNLLRLVKSLRPLINQKGFKFPSKRCKAFTSLLKQLGAGDKEINNIFANIPRTGWKAVGVKSKIPVKVKDNAVEKAHPNYRRILAFKNLITQAAASKEPEKAVSFLLDALRIVLNKNNDSRSLGFLMRDLTQLKIKIRQYRRLEDVDISSLQVDRDPSGVQLSTINGAKGKEWRYVFVIHCVDGFIPIHHAKTEQEIESERMLLYVAITRHKKGLYLMDCPGSRVTYNGGKSKNRRVDVVHDDHSSLITPHRKYLKSVDAA